jgi:uncharacterized protein YcgL (UPF0745 family)
MSTTNKKMKDVVDVAGRLCKMENNLDKLSAQMLDLVILSHDINSKLDLFKAAVSSTTPVAVVESKKKIKKLSKTQYHKKAFMENPDVFNEQVGEDKIKEIFEEEKNKTLIEKQTTEVKKNTKRQKMILDYMKNNPELDKYLKSETEKFNAINNPL